MKIDKNITTDPVFIIGGSRTGSELHRRLLMKYTPIDSISETWWLCPAWLHKDFHHNLLKIAPIPFNESSYSKIIDLMYSKKLFGSFWINKIHDELPKNILEQHFKAMMPVNLSDLFLVVMIAHATHNNKKRIGAKFPVHYSMASKLIDWFPQCQIIHTVRDPRAVMYSQQKKHHNSAGGIINNAWMSFKQCAHINIQYNWSLKVHDDLSGNKQYYLSRYEDILSDPDLYLRKICKFIGIDFNPEMIEPELESDSSFDNLQNRPVGIYSNSLEAWRKESLLSVKTLEILQKNSMERLGYK